MKTVSPGGPLPARAGPRRPGGARRRAAISRDPARGHATPRRL